MSDFLETAEPLTYSQMSEHAVNLEDEVERLEYEVVRLNKCTGTDELNKPYYQWLKQQEEIYFKNLMKITNSNQSKVAVLAGLNRGTVRKKLKQSNLIPGLSR